MSTVEEKVQAGLKMLKPEAMEELTASEKIGLVLYFAGEPMQPAEVAKYVQLPVDQVRRLLGERKR